MRRFRGWRAATWAFLVAGASLCRAGPDLALREQSIALSDFLADFDATMLRGDAREAYRDLNLAVSGAEAAKDPAVRAKCLKICLERSRVVLAARPVAVPIWALRGLAALEASDATSGREAALRLLQYGITANGDDKTLQVLRSLQKKGWIELGAVPDSVGAAEREAEPSFEGQRISLVRNDSSDPFASYYRQLCQQIQGNWDQEVYNSRIEPPAQTMVMVHLTLDRHGNATNVACIASTSSAEENKICLRATAEGGPYGEWSQAMVKVLGNSRDLILQFYYQ
jgi:hypothetical protein